MSGDDPLARPLAYHEVYPDGEEMHNDDEGTSCAPPPPEDGDAAQEGPVPARRRVSWTAAELMAHEFPPQRWAVPGIIAEGLTIIAAPPKAGKSWLALGLAVAVASGGVALGRVPVDEGDVLYLALEDVPRRLQERLRLVLGDAPAPARLTITTECEAIPTGGAERLRRWLAAHPDARLVVVDVLARVRGRSNDRATLYENDYRAAAQLKALADEFAVAFVVIHHTRKAAADDFLDALSGSQGLAGAADAVVVLSRARGQAQAVLRVTGRDVEEAEYALSFDGSTGTWQLLDGPAAHYQVSDERRRILEAVSGADGIGPKAIAEVSGVGYDVVRHLVRKLVDEGLLDTDGAGHYLLPVHSLHSVHTEPVTVNAVTSVNDTQGEQA